MRKVFHIFTTNAKSVSIFLQSGKVVEFFCCQDAKTIRYFSVVYNFSSVFPSMCAKTIRVFQYMWEFGALN